MNGIIVIDKPKGKTSHDVVTEVKKILGAEKAGHTGTLDPLATGVLPVCINEATKLSRFFNMDEKEYRATMLLGVRTDTNDVEGKIIAEEKPEAGIEEIENALRFFVGKRRQNPPSYSAVKYHGKPLYKWTRKGIAVDVMPRSIEIYSLSLEDVCLPYVTFMVHCSKGTYIRSLCAEIGEMLGCGACLAELRRTRSGKYNENEAIRYTDIDERKRREALKAHLIKMADVLLEFPAVQIDKPLAEKMRQGYQPVVDSLTPHHIPFLAAGDMLRFIEDCRLVAIAEVLHSSDQLPLMDGQQQAVRIMRVFNGV